MSLPVAILAGGLATRLWPLTEAIPKSLVDVGGRPFAELQLELLTSHGIRDVVFLAGHLGDMLADTLGDGSRLGIRIRYVFDGPERLGTGGAIVRALPTLGDRFFVLYGDSYLDCDYAAIERAFLTSGKSGLMTVCRNDNSWDASNVLVSGGRIQVYDKQRRTQAMRHIDYGLGAFTASAFAAYASGQALDLEAVYQELLRQGDLAGYEVAGRFYEVGSPNGLEETREYFATRRTTPR